MEQQLVINLQNKEESHTSDSFTMQDQSSVITIETGPDAIYIIVHCVHEVQHSNKKHSCDTLFSSASVS